MTSSEYATAAMQALINPELFNWNVGQTRRGNDERHQKMAEQVAKVAWMVADEMMKQEKERNRKR